MIWVRTSPARTAPHDAIDPDDVHTPGRWPRDPDTASALTGIVGRWHLVSSDETPVVRQFHWSIARPARTSQRWHAAADEHGPVWIAALRQQPALLSITIEGLFGRADRDRFEAPHVASSYDVVERARWTTEPAPVGLDLQLLTMDVDASTTIRLTYVNCFVDAARFENAYRIVVAHLAMGAAA